MRHSDLCRYRLISSRNFATTYRDNVTFPSIRGNRNLTSAPRSDDDRACCFYPLDSARSVR